MYATLIQNPKAINAQGRVSSALLGITEEERDAMHLEYLESMLEQEPDPLTSYGLYLEKGLMSENTFQLLSKTTNNQILKKYLEQVHIEELEEIKEKLIEILINSTLNVDIDVLALECLKLCFNSTELQQAIVKVSKGIKEDLDIANKYELTATIIAKAEIPYLFLRNNANGVQYFKGSLHLPIKLQNKLKYSTSLPPLTKPLTILKGTSKNHNKLCDITKYYLECAQNIPFKLDKQLADQPTILPTHNKEGQMFSDFEKDTMLLEAQAVSIAARVHQDATVYLQYTIGNNGRIYGLTTSGKKARYCLRSKDTYDISVEEWNTLINL